MTSDELETELSVDFDLGSLLCCCNTGMCVSFTLLAVTFSDSVSCEVGSSGWVECGTAGGDTAVLVVLVAVLGTRSEALIKPTRLSQTCRKRDHMVWTGTTTDVAYNSSDVAYNSSANSLQCPPRGWGVGGHP